MDEITLDDILAHHGVIGQKWGRRRYQPYPKNWKGIQGDYIGKKRKNLKQKRAKKIIDRKLSRPTGTRDMLVKARTGLNRAAKKKANRVAMDGNAESVSSFSKYMTSEQLSYARSRLNFDAKLSSINSFKRKKVIKEFNKQIKKNKRKKIKPNYQSGKKLYDEALENLFQKNKEAK